MKKSALAVALLGLGFGGVSSVQAATCATAGACFEFIGGGAAVGGGLSPPLTGSWFSMLALDTNTDAIPDTNLFTSMRSAGGTGTPGVNGFLNFSQINTLGVGNGAATGVPPNQVFRNTGNMIDRDWNFFGGWGAHYTNQVLEVTGTGNTLSVNMAGWTVGWNSGSIDMGAGAAAVLSNVDGIWGNGNDTLDYAAVVPNGSFAGVQYAVHLVGSYNPVPIPAAVWLLGSGLIGLVGVARRRKVLAV